MLGRAMSLGSFGGPCLLVHKCILSLDDRHRHAIRGVPSLIDEGVVSIFIAIVLASIVRLLLVIREGHKLNDALSDENLSRISELKRLRLRVPGGKREAGDSGQ